MSDVLFNKNDYKILETLIERECNAPAASLTIKQLMSMTGMSLSKIRSVISNFLLIGLVKEGSKDGNNKTYYCSPEGLAHFKLVFGFKDDDINEMVISFNNEYEGE